MKSILKAIKEFLELEIISIGNYKIMVHTIVLIIAIFIFTKIALWIIKQALNRQQRKNNLDSGNTYAIFQIIKYLIWVIAFGFILEAIGIKVTVLIAGSAALLVGVGLGLQQTFNDIISGIILLSERSIKIDDILEIDGDILKIQEIGLRTSKGLNRDEISIIIPNSLITTNKVINWSHQSRQTRFKINVGVAYGSDVDLVEKVLTESAWEHPEVSDKNLINVRFLDFGDSCLQFQVIFFSKNIFRIERVKSDIRKVINKKFIENNITIPFPQMDLHFKTNFSDANK
ncbi:mechanosensitive ion channel domain-containing protein [Lutibacter sp.]|uniref:mechanosensitive ion channel family protein n=1 Tax=Lutibacter sp. TaxID=1925666 RepID=UPI001A247468|nr:mechanosensitive ion channel domain-containing protein [Lutibacter sp.]MBI9040967.1 mechanosensitive ion channel [Lutibacter sp.]